MTWYVQITPSQMAIEAGAKPAITVIESDDCEDFFKWRYEWTWATVEKLLDSGVISRVDIDYKPGGVSVQSHRIQSEAAERAGSIRH